MINILNSLNEDELKTLNVERILKDYNLTEGDIIRLSIYYSSLFNQHDNEDANINFISKLLGMAEKNIRKIFKKEKFENIQKYFLTKLFNKTINILVGRELIPMDLKDFCSVTERYFKNKIKEQTKESMEDIIKNDIHMTINLILMLFSTGSDKLGEFISLFEDENDLKKYENMAQDMVIDFVSDINKYIYKRDIKIECDLKENLEFTIEMIEEQKKNYEKIVLKKDERINKLEGENLKLKEELEEKNKVIDKLSFELSNKLIDKKILVIADQGRSREYFEELKKFGLKEKNYFHLNGMSEPHKVKNYKNSVDVVFNFISQTKHTADRQLESFPKDVQIIKLNRTGISQLYEGIKQIRV